MSDLQDIRQLVDTAQVAQSEPDPFLALHTPDAVIVNFGGRPVLGRDELEQAMRALASPMANVTTTAEIHDIRFGRPDVAIVSCNKIIYDQRDSGEVRSASPLTYVVVNDRGAWS
jgi:uncharacterized protein (TIGR02246 family)